MAQRRLTPAVHGTEDERQAIDLARMRLELASGLPAGTCLSNATGPQLLATYELLRDRLARTNTRTAAGPDSIDGYLLRWASAASEWMQAMTALVNFCFLFRVLPQAWRDADLIPLPKKGGPPTEPSSYRPISITPIVARQVERLVQPRLNAILEPYLSRWQAGFRKGRGTRHQIWMLHHRITEAITPGVWNDARGYAKAPRSVPYPVVFLDISRAFDSVPHELLLLKLWRAGARTELLGFLAAFLAGRRFRLRTHAARRMDGRAGGRTAGRRPLAAALRAVH